MSSLPFNQMVSARDALLKGLNKGARPRHKWGIGLESEKLVVDAQSGEAAGYTRIRELLSRLEGTFGWQGIYSGEFLIGLQGPRSSVTLEPGGQLELSGRLCCDLHCNRRDLKRYVEQIRAVAPELGLSVLGFGVQPFTPLEGIDWLPKKRYNIMGPYMQRTGDMGQRMMKQTAGTQVNLDYLDSADCMRKFRLLQWIAPLFYALFANSPLLDGKLSQFLSVRGEIWSRTDNDRCGLIPAFMDEGGTLEDYVEYALDVPLYFIERDGQLIDMTDERRTFRTFLDAGAKGKSAELRDWDLHLSTLFPEVRLRPQLELRTPDSLPPDLALAVAALVKGLFYDEDALDRTEVRLREVLPAERIPLYRDSWRLGLAARCKAFSLHELAVDLVSVARDGLKNQYQQGLSAADETSFLNPLSVILARGTTLAEQLHDGWRGSRSEKLSLLRHLCDYRFHDSM